MWELKASFVEKLLILNCKRGQKGVHFTDR